MKREHPIAILLPNLRMGGAEKIMVSLANEFVGRGFPVDMVLLGGGAELAGLLDSRVRLFDLKARRIRNSVRPLANYLRERKPRAMFANMWPVPLLGMFARLFARSGTRLIGIEHTTWSASDLFSRPLTRWAIRASMSLFYRHLDEVVAVSAGAADDLATIAHLPRHSIHVVHNPIVGASTGVQTESSEALAHWTTGSHFKLLAVGTLAPWKSFDLILRALPQLGRSLDVRLLVLGEGSERARLEGLAAQLHVEHMVSMPGFVQNPRPYFQAADLLVVSSKVEGFGNVIVEALEQGTPVVSTDCPSGPREILDGGKFGALVPVGDVDALAAAIRNELSKTPNRECLMQRANDFSVEKAVNRYLQIANLG